MPNPVGAVSADRSVGSASARPSPPRQRRHRRGCCRDPGERAIRQLGIEAVDVDFTPLERAETAALGVDALAVRRGSLLRSRPRRASVCSRASRHCSCGRSRAIASRPSPARRSISARSTAVGTSALRASACGPRLRANAANGAIHVHTNIGDGFSKASAGHSQSDRPESPAETCNCGKRMTRHVTRH